MDIQPVDRAIHIYEALADRREPSGVRAKLTRHLDGLQRAGEHDPHRLTVHGLSFLRDYELKRNS
jgi:hypothetical protein